MNYRSVQCAAGTVRFIEAGSGPAVLFLHGAGVRASTYAPLIRPLARDFRVIAPDLPGFGGSFTPPSSWAAEDFAACILDFAARLGLDHFDVVAQSFGGCVALAVAAAAPAVGRVVLIDPLAVPPPWGRLAMFFRFFVRKNLPILFHPSRWPRALQILPDFVLGSLRRLHRMPGMTRLVLREVFRTSRPLERVAQPVSLIWGDHDEVFPPESADILASRLPRARKVLVHGGHDWCLFRGVEAASLVTAALL